MTDQRKDYQRPNRPQSPGHGSLLRRGITETEYDNAVSGKRTVTVRIYGPGDDWDDGDDTEDSPDQVWAATERRLHKCRPLFPMDQIAIGTKVLVADVGGRNVIIAVECG